jgi:N-acetylmuramoyl-L-alanine amidase
MRKIFIFAGNSTNEREATSYLNSHFIDMTEAQQTILLRDEIVAELRSRNIQVLAVPEDLDLDSAIKWINLRSSREDLALAIHADTSSHPILRGATVFYVANNSERKQHAESLLLLLMRRLPQVFSRGTKPDTASELGSLSFCRRVIIPSLLIKVAVLTNAEDLSLTINYRRKMALGLVDGLVGWMRELDRVYSNSTQNAIGFNNYPPINIELNGRVYEERGILINGNAYIPIDLADRLGIDLANNKDVRLVKDRSIIYFNAIVLRDRHISVTWEADFNTILLRSILPLSSIALDRIMGNGNTSEVQLIVFLRSNHEEALELYPELPKYYREEGAIEGVNYDIAFCQMCLETDFLRFGKEIDPNTNNFASLGDLNGLEAGAIFEERRLGVRAHIQHLKAYASLEPLVQELIDPRFYLIKRGIASTIDKLSGRWSADLNYGYKLLAIVRRLYESAGLI